MTDTDGHEAYEDHASDPMADSRDRCAMQGGRLGIEPLLRQPDHVDLQAVIERKVTAAEVSFCNSISIPHQTLNALCLKVIDMFRIDSRHAGILWDKNDGI